MPLQGHKLQSFAQRLRTLAPQLSDGDQDELADMVCYLENLGGTVEGRAVPSLEQEALGEIKQALLKLHLKSSRELRLVADTALEIVFPGSGMSSQFKVHGRSEWAQFKVDMAYMLVTRDDNFFRRSVKFGWADSSPQGPFDFLLWKNRYIYMTELLATADAMVTLVNTTGGALGGEVADDFEISLEASEARSSANKVLKKNVREHLYASMFFVFFSLSFCCCCCCRCPCCCVLLVFSRVWLRHSCCQCPCRRCRRRRRRCRLRRRRRRVSCGCCR